MRGLLLRDQDQRMTAAQALQHPGGCEARRVMVHGTRVAAAGTGREGEGMVFSVMH